jgi:hypothetical protein
MGAESSDRDGSQSGARLQRTIQTLVTVIALCGAAAAALAQSPNRIGLPEFKEKHWSGGIVENSAFTPGPDARQANESFTGTLKIGEAAMKTVPQNFTRRRVLGRDPQVFPAVELGFFTVGDDLVPVTQDVIRSGSIGRGKSFWDLIVQPGRIWSEPGDAGWSRAAFPFALVHSLEGETHNGIALFLYRHGSVSNLRFQVVQQTAPYYVADYFSASGLAAATLDRGRIESEAELARIYRASVADSVPLAPWSELLAKVGAKRLEGFDAALEPGDGIAAGLDYEGTFYLQYCRSVAGPMPWCDRARFGVWSATKALANLTALLRLAQKYGPAVFELKIKDYVPEAAAYPGWQSVRFTDAINMATGIGNGSTRREANEAEDGYLDASYPAWYEARSRDAKVAALLRTGRVYPWGPGQVTRYRDQDMFILGVAMDNYLKTKEGSRADLWSMLEREVYEPIGIHYAPTNRTIEQAQHRGHPLMAFGYFPTISDMVKIARLYQNLGRNAGVQILYQPAIEQLRAGEAPRGLPTGMRTGYGETLYFEALWQARYRSIRGCDLYVPVMQGWGSNLVVMMPKGLTAIRLAKTAAEREPSADDPTSMLAVAERLVPFCH